ncbi:hypothetical protein DFH07DRAFT_813152 [Mycena maculata]|uniref:Uncharacterized protein n=1 Tax=Mycena maculata TaxID=230809 RepID=A0AAD7NJD5_9AGAR|nr:hypothetical protein DFH07DRAFT_813152 [Mycena maculata]
MPVEADIAQELIDAILDFLHDDRQSLLHSSLVTRKWVPATRHHIFERIVINHFFAGHRCRGHRDNAHRFLAICDSPHCTILPSVRNVLVNVDTKISPVGPVPALLADIIDALGRAPIVKILFVDHTSRQGSPIALSWIGPRFRDLQELSYNSLEDVVCDLFALVSSFPNLRILSVYSSSKASHTASIAQGLNSPAPHTFAHLHTLRLRLYSHQSEELLSWLQSIGKQAGLETLDLNFFHAYHNGWGAIAVLNSFLHVNGDHLRNLTVRVTYEDSDDEIDETVRLEKPSEGNLDLSGLTNLRSLRLASHNVEAICTALQSLPAQKQTLEAFQVDFMAWIYYLDAPCACHSSIHAPRSLISLASAGRRRSGSIFHGGRTRRCCAWISQK